MPGRSDVRQNHHEIEPADGQLDFARFDTLLAHARKAGQKLAFRIHERGLPRLAVLVGVHLNGYKIANPTVLARISHEELESLFRGYGYTPYFVEGSDPEKMHQPHNLAAIRAVARHAPQLPQVACFDTSFQHNQPAVAQTFALPPRYAEQGVQRYGFHGLSYEYIASVLPGIDRRAATGRTIVSTWAMGPACALFRAGRVSPRR